MRVSRRHPRKTSCSKSYISEAGRAIKEFLEWNFPSFSEQSLSRVNGEMISEFLEKNKEIKRHKVGHIRVFCQYLHGQGYCQVIPSIIFPSRKRYRLNSPPKSISVDSVHKILCRAGTGESGLVLCGGMELRLTLALFMG